MSVGSSLSRCGLMVVVVLMAPTMIVTPHIALSSAHT
jgi:hypothetical protein